MTRMQQLKEEMSLLPTGRCLPQIFRARGYRESTHDTKSGRRADGIAALLRDPVPHIFKNDLVVGCIRPLFVQVTEEELAAANQVVAAYPERGFGTNSDHYSPDYETALRLGIPGMLTQIVGGYLFIKYLLKR